MTLPSLLNQYESGPDLLVETFRDADQVDIDAHPIPGTWSIRETVCHLADSEIVYADRMKRVLAEDNPTFFEADPDAFGRALQVRHRPLQTELQLIAATRSHMVPILRALDAGDWLRHGQHSLDGQMSLQTLLQRITKHIPHHVGFIQAKVAKLLESGV